VIFSKKGNRLVDQTYNCNYPLNRGSMNDSGDLAVQRQTSTGARIVSLFRRRWQCGRCHYPGRCAGGLGHLNGVNYVGAGENGSVYFIGNGDNGTQGAFWWDGKTIRKLALTGESYPAARTR